MRLTLKIHECGWRKADRDRHYITPSKSLVLHSLISPIKSNVHSFAHSGLWRYCDRVRFCDSVFG